MTEPATAFIQTFLSRNRRLALARGVPLPERDQGTGLFADISGFTPLTESLGASLGPQQGAEALTAVINDIFEGLIAQVHAHGGDVLGFAGDAITCWFKDEGGRMKDESAEISSFILPIHRLRPRYAG